MTASNPMAQKRNFIIDPDNFSLIVTIGFQRQKRQKRPSFHDAMPVLDHAGALDDSIVIHMPKL
jgi:hypothetical protein